MTQKDMELSIIMKFMILSSFIWQQIASIEVKLSDLPNLRLTSSSNFLSKGNQTLLSCDLYNLVSSGNEPLWTINKVKWFRDGTYLAHYGTDKRVLSLQGMGRAGVYSLEGNYRCVANIHQIDNRQTIIDLTSAPLTILVANIGKFPNRDFYTRAKSDESTSYDVTEEQDADWLRVDTVQGQLVYVPCLGLPDSAPGPALITFERIRNLKGAKQSEMIERNDERVWLTSTGLQLALAQPADSGKYRCHARNPMTNRTRHQRSWIRLRVAESRAQEVTPEGPVIMPLGRLQYPTQRKIQKMVTVGDDVILECISDLGRIEWKKINQSSFNADSGVDPRIRPKWGSLIIEKVTADDAGVYSCRALPPLALQTASHEQRAPTAQFELIVVSNATATLQVDTVQMKIKCTLNSPLSPASAGGALFPDLLINGQSVTTSSSALIGQWSGTANELTARVSPSARGALVVQCTAPSAVNISGVVTAKYMHGHVSSKLLTMTGAPELSEQMIDNAVDNNQLVDNNDAVNLPSESLISLPPQNVTVAVGESAQLICIVSRSALSVHWLKDDSPVIVDHSRVRLYGSGTLYFSVVQLDDAAWYSCVANSFQGQPEVKRALLTVQGTDFYHLSTHRPRLSFMPGREPSTRAIPKYALATTNTPVTQTTTLVTPASWTHLKMPAPTAEQRGGAIFVQWHALELPNTPVRLQSYSLDVRAVDSQVWTTILDEKQLKDHATNASVDNLLTGRNYTFRVLYHLTSGQHDQLESNASQPVLFMPANSPRFSPHLLKLTSESSTQLKAKWTVSPGQLIDAFVIEYRMKSTYQPFLTQTAEGSLKSEAILTDLIPSTAYLVRLRAVNQYGLSPPSNEMVAWTLAPIHHSTPHEDDWTLSNELDHSGNNQDRSAGVLTRFIQYLNRRLSGQDLRVVLAGLIVIILLITAVCCCLCCLCCRNNKNNKITKASNGKYVDASQRIYIEQQQLATSLYPESFSAGGTLQRSTNFNTLPHAGHNVNGLDKGNRRVPLSMYAMQEEYLGGNGDTLLPLMRTSTPQDHSQQQYSTYEMQQQVPSIYGLCDTVDMPMGHDDDDECSTQPVCPSQGHMRTQACLSPHRCVPPTVPGGHDVGTSPLTSQSQSHNSNSRSTPDSCSSGLHHQRLNSANSNPAQNIPSRNLLDTPQLHSGDCLTSGQHSIYGGSSNGSHCPETGANTSPSTPLLMSTFKPHAGTPCTQNRNGHNQSDLPPPPQSLLQGGPNDAYLLNNNQFSVDKFDCFEPNGQQILLQDQQNSMKDRFIMQTTDLMPKSQTSTFGKPLGSSPQGPLPEPIMVNSQMSRLGVGGDGGHLSD